MSRQEHAMQAEVVALARAAASSGVTSLDNERLTLSADARTALSLMYAVPNGGHRHKAVAGRLKAEGALAGVPDLVLPLPDGETLYLELKTPKGRVSPRQRQVMEGLTDLGHHVYVVRSAHEAWATIINALRR